VHTAVRIVALVLSAAAALGLVWVLIPRPSTENPSYQVPDELRRACASPSAAEQTALNMIDRRLEDAAAAVPDALALFRGASVSSQAPCTLRGRESKRIGRMPECGYIRGSQDDLGGLGVLAVV
jgi:hypothetical protein